MILPRWWKSTPMELNSRLYQPTAAPTIRRPSEMWSMVASSLARMHGIAHRHDEDAGADLDLARARRDGGEDRQRLVDREVGIDAEQNVVPGPDRLVAQLLHAHAVVDQRPRARHLRVLGEVAHGDAELGLLLLGHRCSSRTCHPGACRRGGPCSQLAPACVDLTLAHPRSTRRRDDCVTPCRAARGRARAGRPARRRAAARPSRHARRTAA